MSVDTGPGLLTVDVVLLLPDRLRGPAVRASALLADRLRAAAHPSAFHLDEPFAGDFAGRTEQDGVCEPHVSLFMLRLNERDIGALLTALRAATEGLPPVRARGQVWRHNPQGAPELHFHSSAQWTAVQEAIVRAAEPLRRGLRESDPSGASPADLIERLRIDDPDGAQLAQLDRYGYDEITDDAAQRFSPHVTVAWPTSYCRVDLDVVPAPSACRAELSRMAVYGMAPYGTCVRPLGSWALGRASIANRASGSQSAVSGRGSLPSAVGG
jgi:hypothetical protein